MLLSVVIPVFNRAAELERCLLSLASLVGRGDAEVIVVDDGSRLGERQRIGEIVAKHGVHLLQREHKGVSAARNAGACSATGRFLWFVDADDEANMASLDSLVKALSSLPDECQIFITSLPGQPIRQLSKNPIRTQFPAFTNHTLCFISRHWLMQHPELFYPEDMSVLEDTIFILRLLAAAHEVAEDSHIHPYRINRSVVSVTSGAWSDERSHRFIADICRFFDFLKEFSILNSQFSILNLKRCYRFVYLRTLAVKGCPWSDIKKLRATVDCTKPYIPFERLLFFAPFHRTLAFVCRTIRKRR